MKTLICSFFLVVLVTVSGARYFDDITRDMRMYDYRSYQDDSPGFKSYGDDFPAPRDGYFRSYREVPHTKGYTVDGEKCTTKCRFGTCWVESAVKFVECTMSKPAVKPPVVNKVSSNGYATDGSGRECLWKCSKVSHTCFVRRTQTHTTYFVACTMSD